MGQAAAGIVVRARPSSPPPRHRSPLPLPCRSACGKCCHARPRLSSPSPTVAMPACCTSSYSSGCTQPRRARHPSTNHITRSSCAGPACPASEHSLPRTRVSFSNVASIYSASLGDSTSTRLQRDQAKQCILTVSLRPRPARRARLADHFPNPCAPLPMARGHDGPPPCLPRAGAAPGHRNRDGAGRVLATTMVVA